MKNEPFLADRLNNEPPILGGLTNTELGMVIKFGLAFWVPTCLFIASMLGNTMMGVGVSMLMVFLTVVIGGKLFQQIKRGRPDHYYEHYLMMRKKNNTRSEDVLKYSGTWSVGRE